MKHPTPVFSILAVVCLLAVLGPTAAVAEEAPMDEAAMMEAWAAAGTPGEHHARLAETAGSWNMEVKMWMGPGDPMVSTGTAERKMILGGRVLMEEVTSSMMGGTMNGIAMTGYDNVTGKLWSTWTDSTSTGLTSSEGTYDAETGVYTFHGEMPDPMSGGMKSVLCQVLDEGRQRGHGDVRDARRRRSEDDGDRLLTEVACRTRQRSLLRIPPLSGARRSMRLSVP